MFCYTWLLLLLSPVVVMASVHRVELENVAGGTRYRYNVRKRGDEGSTISELLQLGEGVSLEVVDSIVTVQGNTKSKYRETYNGIVVYDTGLDVEQDETGGGEVVEADVFAGLETDLGENLDCQLSNDEALDVVIEFLGLEDAEIETSDFNEIIYIDEDKKAHDAVDVQLLVTSEDQFLSRPRTFVAKCTREVLESYDRLGLATADSSITPSLTTTTTATTTTTQPLAYLINPEEEGAGLPQIYCDVKQKIGNPNRPVILGGDNHCLTLRKSSDGKYCFLENYFVKGVDLRWNVTFNATDIAAFECEIGYLDGTQGAYSPMLDAFFFASKSVEMYREWYGYRAMSDPTPYVKVHLEVDTVNAFYHEDVLYFTNGDGVSLYPLTVLDFVAHELSHGVIEKTSGLKYENQSGGMNEAFADMAGVVAELYVFGKHDYLVGSDIFMTTKAQAFRKFEDPTFDGNSIKNAEDFVPGLDVHYSSGVYNYIFWQMAETNKMGPRDAFECFLVATRLYWRENTNFETGACDVVRAAYDMGYDMDIVADSFRSAGINFTSCPDFERFVTSELTPGIEQENVIVTETKNPLFKIIVPQDSRKVKVKGSKGTFITISQSYSRSSAVLGQGKVTAEAEVNAGGVIFARLSLASKEDENVPARVSVSFN